jgi:hypothetical protein
MRDMKVIMMLVHVGEEQGGIINPREQRTMNRHDEADLFPQTALQIRGPSFGRNCLSMKVIQLLNEAKVQVVAIVFQRTVELDTLMVTKGVNGQGEGHPMTTCHHHPFILNQQNLSQSLL